jgi:arsenate reductase (thioredoxin)
MAKSNVLFLCTGNSCRSQMAEGRLKELSGETFNVYSAGTDPAESVHPLAVEVMQERGIDISEQTPKHVKEFLGKLPVKHLVIVCEGADGSCPRIFPGMMNRHLWPFDDPAGFVGSLEAIKEKFRTVRDQIEARIKNWLEQEL